MGVAKVEGAGWQARGLEAELRLDAEDEQPSRLRIAELVLPEPIGTLRDLTILCPALQIATQSLNCEQARIQLESQLVSGGAFPGAFAYRLDEGLLTFELRGAPLMKGRVALSGRYAADGWSLDLEGEGLSGTQAAALLGGYVELPEGLEAAGELDLKLRLAGGAKKNLGGQAELTSRSLSLNEPSGTLATEGLGARAEVTFEARADGWQFAGGVESDTGQAYFDPVFVDFAKHPASLKLEPSQWTEGGRLTLNAFELEQPQTLAASGSAAFDFSGPPDLLRLRLDIRQARFPAAYNSYVQPFLIGTPLDALESEGAASGEVVYEDAAFQTVRLKLDQVEVRDTKGRFAVEGVDGDLHWTAERAGETAPASRLSWRGGSAYKIAFGPADVELAAAGDDLRLLAPARVPLLDGALAIDTLAVENAAADEPEVRFEAELEPIDLGALTRALGWPEFGGTLGGRLPTLEYRDGVISLEGGLKAQVFDGEVAVSALRLEQPFGVLPRLTGNAKGRSLDLEKITGAFSFGKITGLLHADVEDLVMLNWQPVVFDARLYSAPRDEGLNFQDAVAAATLGVIGNYDRRISQRAIDNISSIGGGPSGALARGFMGFFDDFAYDRIGIGCKLARNVCHMQGLAPAEGGGYYIIRGRFLPRIDVIGYAREVSWPALVEQLKAATESQGPVVQ